jgi:hypothetical protein
MTKKDKEYSVVIKERAIAKLVALGLTEEELRELGLTSNGNS